MSKRKILFRSKGTEGTFCNTDLEIYKDNYGWTFDKRGIAIVLSDKQLNELKEWLISAKLGLEKK